MESLQNERVFVILLYMLTAVFTKSFNPICYRDPSEAFRVQSKEDTFKQQDLQLLNVTVIKPVDGIVFTVELKAIPKPECGLDIYMNTSFDLLTASLDLAEFICETSTPEYSSAIVEILQMNLRFSEFKTTVVIRLPSVYAEREDIYNCFAKHEDFVNGKALEFSIVINVNGCPAGYWGGNCISVCGCENGGICHPWDGSCLCPKIWTGDYCEKSFPHVEAASGPSEVFVGEDVSMKCEAYVLDEDETEIRWYMNGSVLNEKSWNLTVLSVSDADAGIYTCEAKNNNTFYKDTIYLDILGCQPGWYGENCTRVCECEDNETCHRDQGCQCNENCTRSTFVICDDGVVRETCHHYTDKASVNPTVLGLSIGGVILGLSLVVVALVLFRLKHCQQTNTISIRSQLDQDYFMSKDVYDLIKDKWGCLSKDLGILWSQWNLSNSDLYIEDQIDGGHFSLIYNGYVVKDRHFYPVAVKVLKDEKDGAAWEGLMTEFKTLATVTHHKNIVQLIGISSKMIMDKDVCCLVLEYLPLGSLYKLLHANRKPKECAVLLKPENYRDIVVGILQGMCRLEELRYVHRDLASRNILLTEDLVAKISDFGLTRDTYATTEYTSSRERPMSLPYRWMALECWKDDIFTNKSDMWSFGVLLWEITTLGANPYPGFSHRALLNYLEAGQKLQCPKNCSPVWYSAMQICWVVDPDERPSFAEILPFFQDLFRKDENLSPFLEDIRDTDNCVIEEPGAFILDNISEVTDVMAAEAVHKFIEESKTF